jgi:ABC-2 type transport system permease protein
MRLILLSALKDIRRMRRDPIGLAAWIGIPVLVSLLLVALFGRGEPKPQGLVLIADQDDTFVSGLLARVYTQGKLGEMLTVQQVPLEEGRKRIGSGDGSALLVIPKGFATAVLRNTPVNLELVTNPSQAILPGIVKEVTSVLVDGAWYLQQFIGEDLERFSARNGPPPDALIAEFSIKIRRLVESYRGYVDPPLIDVVSRQTATAPLNIAPLMFPSMLYMTILFLSFGFGGDIWKEKRQGTLRRLAVTPGSVAQFLAGKLLALACVFVLVALIALSVGVLLLGLKIPNPVLTVLWIVVSGAGIYLLFLVLYTLASGQRAASLLVNLAVMVLAMIGGCFFPFEMMPDFLARIGRSTPNGWALLRMKEILAGPVHPGALTLAFAGAAAGATLLFVIALARVRRSFIV